MDSQYFKLFHRIERTPKGEKDLVHILIPLPPQRECDYCLEEIPAESSKQLKLQITEIPSSESSRNFLTKTLKWDPAEIERLEVEGGGKKGYKGGGIELTDYF